VPGIEPGPPDLLPRTLTTRPQRRSSNLVYSADGGVCSCPSDRDSSTRHCTNGIQAFTTARFTLPCKAGLSGFCGERSGIGAVFLRLLGQLGVATTWTKEVRLPAEAAQFFCSPQRPSQLRRPPRLLCSAYQRLIPRGVKTPKRQADHSISGTVELFLTPCVSCCDLNSRLPHPVASVSLVVFNIFRGSDSLTMRHPSIRKSWH
jgi:hypothetical protein